MTDVMDFGRMSSIAFLVFIVSVSAQTSNENVCRVALFCDDDSPNIQSRAIEMNSIKGDRGHPGYVGPIGPLGPSGTSRMDRQSNVLNEMRQMEEIFSQKFAAVAQQITEIAELAAETESSIQRFRDELWGQGGITASNGYRYKRGSLYYDNFGNAKRACREMGGHLAYEGMRNATLFREIMPSVRGSWRMCIDLTDLAREGHYVWSDGVPVSQEWANWDTTKYRGANYGRPNNNCVYVSSGSPYLWQVMDCNSNCHAICEQKISRD